MKIKTIVLLAFLYLMSNQIILAQDSLAVSKIKQKLDSISTSILDLDERNIAYEQLIENNSLIDIVEIVNTQAKDDFANRKFSSARQNFEVLLTLESKESSIKNMVHYYLGYCYLILNHINKAIESYNFVINNYENSELVQYCSIYLATCYLRIGEKELALSVMKSTNYSNPETYFLILGETASVYINNHDFELASNYLDTCLMFANTRKKMANIFFKRSSLEIKRKNYHKAIDNLNQSLIYNDLNFVSVKIYNNYALALNKLKDPRSKIYSDSAILAIKSYIDAPYNYQFAISYQNLAEYYSGIGEHEKAIQCIDSCIYHQCYGIALEGTPNNYKIDLLILDDKLSLIEFLDVKIDILESAGDSLAIEKNYLFLDSVIQAVREERYDDNGRFFQQAKLSKYYKEAFSFFLERKNYKMAYSFTQKMKNVILLENFHYKNARKKLPKDYATAYFQLEDSIKNLSLKIKSESISDSLYFEISKLKLSMINFRNKLKQKFPSYHQMRFRESGVSIEDIQALCSTDQILLDYFISDSVLHIFSISQNSFNYESKVINSNFSLDLKELIDKIGNRPSMIDFSKNNIDLKTLSEHFYEILIPNNIDPFKTLIIIPYDRLFYLPFEALINVNSEKSCPFLVCAKSISYSFSASLWKSSKENQRPISNKTMIFSPHQTSKDSKLYLEFAEEESSQIKQITRADLFTELDTESFFEKSNDYDIHHYLSHAFISRKNAESSYFSMGEKFDSLSMDRIISSNLNSKLVCMSACDTGTGNLEKDEGVISLARAFLESGAESIVMAYFKISDKTSSSIMVDFYKYLKNGNSKSEAISYSKRNYIQSSSKYMSHPYFWSAFTVQGNEAALYSKPNYTGKGIIAFLILSLIGIMIYRSKKNKI